MWCANCQADVAAEVTANEHRILCASCGSDLSNGTQTTITPQARQAQQILDRWSHQSMSVPASPAVSVSHSAEASLNPEPIPDAAAVSESNENLSPERVLDDAVSQPDQTDAPVGEMADTAPAASAAVEQIEVPISDEADQAKQAAPSQSIETQHVDRPTNEESSSTTSDTQRESATLRFDAPHMAPPRSNHGSISEPNVQRPARRVVAQPVVPDTPVSDRVAAEHPPLFNVRNFDAQLEISRRQQRQAKWVASTAQFLTYCGIGGLTVGTSCVIWGYFGNVASYLPLGWLVLSFGQMLLFLGMVTMVSCSVEQSNTDLTRQLAEIQKHLARLQADQPRVHSTATTATSAADAAATARSPQGREVVTVR